MASPRSLRCDGKLHGVVTEENLLEVKCSSRHCGERGEVVLHYFEPTTGRLVETRKFREPPLAGRKGSACR